VTLRRWLPWLVLGIALMGALAIGARGTAPEPTDAERVHAIAASVRCPMCPGQAAAGSEAPSAVSMRADIARRVALGQSDDEIRQAYAESYGPHILLNPPRDGIAGLVWALPAVLFVVAVAGLVLAFRRWSGTAAEAEPSADDRDLVERARRRSSP
jgi:cytochrome c-type biogenesis protein CcmH/NrfF